MFINPLQISGVYSSTKGIQVKIDGKLYPIEDLINKSVYAKTKALWYRYPEDPKSAKLASPAGSLVGKVYSWITRADGIYAMFNLSTGSIYLKDYPSGSYYVKLEDLSDQELKQQGVKTTKEAVKEETAKEEAANKTNTDKILDTAKQVALYGTIGIVVAIVLKSLIQNKL